jgi:hypothetical protein
VPCAAASQGTEGDRHRREPPIGTAVGVALGKAVRKVVLICLAKAVQSVVDEINAADDQGNSYISKAGISKKASSAMFTQMAEGWHCIFS